MNLLQGGCYSKSRKPRSFLNHLKMIYSLKNSMNAFGMK